MWIEQFTEKQILVTCIVLAPFIAVLILGLVELINHLCSDMEQKIAKDHHDLVNKILDEKWIEPKNHNKQ